MKITTSKCSTLSLNIKAGIQSRVTTTPISLIRRFHRSTSRSATPLPFATAGPAPHAPTPAASQSRERLDRRQRQAALLQKGQDLRTSQMKPGTAINKRFWKDVNVRTTPEGHHTIHLDERPVRAPSTKAALLIPASKPYLASAIALEWDLLVSAQQALKQHLIPLTSLASRAYDIAQQDDGKAQGNAREDIVKTLMRYLDTDTLLCWAPSKSLHDAPGLELSDEREGKRLRDIQIKVATPIIAHLTTNVWPGVEIQPVLDDGSIVPVEQPRQTRDVIRGWISGLDAWELAGLERAVLAGKSLCVAARLVAEWSEKLRGVGESPYLLANSKRFGIEEAAEACSLEVRWQTGMWGEVEDTHDVENEDIKRQMGSVILIVGGTG